ncbi:MAG: putative peptidoglycan glycosyltransferase FtsW [Patescibacteria group bacterium]
MRKSVLLTALVLGFCVFGVIMVGNSSVVTAVRDFSDKWYYFKLQLGWAGLGMLAFLFLSNFNHKRLEPWAVPFMAISMLLLVAVLIPGLGLNLLGARRWIGLGLFSFQPAEVAKLAICIYLAVLFKKPYRFLQFLAPVVVVSGLIMLEPDLGTTITIVGTAFFMYLGTGGKLLHLTAAVPIGILAVLLLIYVSPYRMARLKTFFDHTSDPLGASYQIRQSLIGIGSGGFLGRGLGQSRQKYEFLPEVNTDSIFAVITEELGFVGAICLIFGYLLLIITGLQVSEHSQNIFSKNLSLGLTCLVGIQAFINLSSLLALFPLTGIPLTFVSYGGTSLVTALSASGILVNIAKSEKL